MPRHSFAHHNPSRGGGLRGWLIGFGVVLAIITGLFTFFVGIIAWLFFGALRVLTSPFRSNQKGHAGHAKPIWTVHVDRPGARPRQGAEVSGQTFGGSDSIGSPSRPDRIETQDAEDADFEEIR